MTDIQTMTSSRPYLIRALYEWIADNGMTPLLLVDADVPGAKVPRAFVDNGKIILNVSMSAVRELELGDEIISFRARFGGADHQIFVPVSAVQAVYARETSAGMMFPEQEHGTATAGKGEHGAADAEGKENDRDERPETRPNLRVIK